MSRDLKGYGPLSLRATWAKRALIAVLVLNVVSIVSAYFAYQTYGADSSRRITSTRRISAKESSRCSP